MPKAKPLVDGPKFHIEEALNETQGFAEKISGLKDALSALADGINSRLTIGQIQILFHVASHGASGEPIVISALRNIGPHAHKTYQPLVSDGLIEIVPDDRDTRRKYLFLTCAGYSLIKKVAERLVI